jgi:hypothetical protein
MFKMSPLTVITVLPTCAQTNPTITPRTVLNQIYYIGDAVTEISVPAFTVTGYCTEDDIVYTTKVMNERTTAIFDQMNAPPISFDKTGLGTGEAMRI